MLKIKFPSVALLLMLGVPPVLRVCAEEVRRGSITIDRIADIKYPTDEKWSPDGKTIAFLWDAAGNRICLWSSRENSLLL